MFEKRRILGNALYAVYLLILLEVGSRVLVSIGPIFRRVKGWDDSSYRIEWARRHSSGQELPEGYNVYHPTRGWALKPGIKNMNIFDGKILNSNSKGVRGKADYGYSRHEGKKRILVLGDSFSFGADVSDDETYSHYLESLLPDVEVLNLGVSGYGHDQMLLYLKEEGWKYKPDVVLMGFVSFDTFRNVFKFFAYAKPRFDLQGHALRLTNVPVPPPELMRDREFYWPKALDLGVMLFQRFRWRFGLNQERAQEITEAIFDEMVAITRQAGAALVFAYLPVGDELFNSIEAMTTDEQKWLTYCEERRIPFVFLREKFLAARRETGVAFNTHRHWLASEHLIAAQAIKEHLVREGLMAGVTPSRSAFGAQVGGGGPTGRRKLDWRGLSSR